MKFFVFLLVPISATVAQYHLHIRVIHSNFPFDLLSNTGQILLTTPMNFVQGLVIILIVKKNKNTKDVDLLFTHIYAAIPIVYTYNTTTKTNQFLLLFRKKSVKKYLSKRRTWGVSRLVHRTHREKPQNLTFATCLEIYTIPFLRSLITFLRFLVAHYIQRNWIRIFSEHIENSREDLNI